MTTFKLDYSNITTDETLNKFRNSKYIGIENLKVKNNLSVGNFHVDDGHITTSDKIDPVIYLDSQTNILQSAYTEDLDVINIDKNTSFVDYTKLSKTFYTKIGGSGGEYNYKNNRCVDKNNNLYIIAETDSDVVNIFDSTNNNVPVHDIHTSEDGDSENVIIVKYNHLGEFQWTTNIGGYYAKFYPSLVCDGDGNVFVCFGNANGNNNDVLIYDTVNVYSPVSTLTGAADDSSIIVKYNSDGIFQWVNHIDGIYDDSSPVYPRISCDINGNVFLAHALYARKLQIYDQTPEEYVPLPDDFFCVIIEHFHTGHLKYTQPIYSFHTGESFYNYVVIKFDNDGKLKWVNHIEMEYSSDYDPRCFIDNDTEGNVLLSGNFSGNLNIFNPLNINVSRPDGTITPFEPSYNSDNTFLVKYDKNGSFIWGTKTAAYDNDTTDAILITDVDGNIYYSFRSRDNITYLFDTTDKINPQYEFSIKQGYRSLNIVKYNSEGIIQWYTSVDGYNSKYEPCIALDNRFVKGSDNSNVYLSGAYYGPLNFYNSTDLTHIAYTLSYDYVNESENAFISCFDQDGKFSWATKTATLANDFYYSDAYKISIAADKDGHVYFMGSYEYTLNIYDAQNNDIPVVTLTKFDNNLYQTDIFIIKYNRYGLLNLSNPKLLYIEDNSDLPDSFCKEVILTNNDHNGIVNLQILKKENYGYSVRRNVLITEAIELITKDGLWIPKIISDQYEYVNDLDVIDTSTKTSFVNYQNLQNSFYTKIGGNNYDANPQMYLDKHDNVYIAGVFVSSELGIYDFTNNEVPVGSLTLNEADQALFLTKYDSTGVNKWYTKIGGYYVKSEPSVFVNGSGDMFVTMQSYDDGDILIYDTKDKNIPAKTLGGLNSGDANTIFVKYNTKGEFQWNVRVIAFNTPESPTFTSTAVVTGDLEGNLFVCGYFNGEAIVVFDTSDDEIPQQVFVREEYGPGAYFILKFDYTGKFLWVNHIEGGLIPNNDIGPPPDWFKFIRINLNTDSLGNLYLTSSYYYLVIIFDPDSTQVENLFFGGEDGIGIFTIKYNSSGFYQWFNGISSNAGGMEFNGVIESGSCVDADGNVYVSFSNAYLYDYDIYDTRVDQSQPVYHYENNYLHDVFVSVVKFNHNGIFQWNNVIKPNENESGNDIVFHPVITCDNQYITGQYNPNIYVHLNGYVNDYRSGFNFYNASSTDTVAYTLPSKDYWMEDSTVHSILAKYDTNGNFQWATTAAGYSYEGDYDILAADVKADKLGHVYISGSYYNYDLYIWDVSTNGFDDHSVGRLTNIGDTDCFLIKYNKYGLMNNNFQPNIYIEDVSNIPNAFEKSIVITNNTANGHVNCQILEPLASGFGYNIRKTITLIDCLDLVSNNGKWIPKIQSEQISLSVDVDVIDVNTKLSILDYSNLNNLSWATTIGGEDDERNLRLSCDKYNNVYGLFSFDSYQVFCYYYNDYSYRTENRFSSNRDIALIKYLSDGSIDWFSRIGFDADFKGYPSLYTDAEGNSYVSIVKTNDGESNNIYIYETRDTNQAIKTVLLSNSGTSLIKFGKDGAYLWDIHINAYYNSGDGTNASNAVADKNGNVYMAGFISDNDGIVIVDASDYVKREISNATMFIVKFDKIGKYIWSIPIYGSIRTNDSLSIACDQDGDVFVSAMQENNVTVYHLVDDGIRYYDDFNKVDNSFSSLFTLKYNTDGKCLWFNRLGSNDTSGINGQIYQPVAVVDSYGNYYLAVQMGGQYAYIYDTRSRDNIRFSIPIPTVPAYNTFFAKYNKNGIVQWYNFISGYSGTPNICVDNRFIQGKSDNSVYLSGSYNGTEGSGDIFIYNSGSNGDYPYIEADVTSDICNSYLTKYDTDGYLIWCSKVGGSYSEINNSVVATGDGHVYLGGEFDTDHVDVFQGWTLGMDPNSNYATQLYNYSEGGGSFDIFLVKYNRYGTVNNGNFRFGREIYLENNESIPDGTEKSIVIINNGENNGIRENVCLIILEYNNPGYYSFRNLWFSEGVSLISYGGRWYVKSSSNDVLPKRSIIMWEGNESNIPLGWHLCDGGSLNGVTTPDLRGRFILGYNNNATGVNGSSADGGNTNVDTGARTSTVLSGSIGRTGGEVLHTITTNELTTHNHGITDPGHNHSATTYDAGSIHNEFGSNTSYAGGGTAYTNTNTTGITINNTGGSQPHNNIPPYYVLAFIMKCF